VIGYFGFSEERNKLIDYPHPTGITPLALIIPKPTAQKKNHFVAIWQPFQPQVFKNPIINI